MPGPLPLPREPASLELAEVLRASTLTAMDLFLWADGAAATIECLNRPRAVP